MIAAEERVAGAVCCSTKPSHEPNATLSWGDVVSSARTLELDQGADIGA